MTKTTLINGVEYSKQLLPLFEFRDINLEITTRLGERCKLCNERILQDTLKLRIKFYKNIDQNLDLKNIDLKSINLQYKRFSYNFCINCAETILKEFDKCKMWKLEQQLKINAFIEIIKQYKTKTHKTPIKKVIS